MRLGALVVRKNMWGIDAKGLGLVIGKSQGIEPRDDIWIVLWTTKTMSKIQQHFGDALADVSADREEDE